MTTSQVDKRSDSQIGAQILAADEPAEGSKPQSFIDCLPNELLAEIFVICTPPNRYPLDLLKTCRHWTAVAYGTPSLWNKIAIGFGKKGTIPMSQLPVWIDRAGGFPLNLTVHIPRDTNTLDHCRDLDNLLRNRSVNILTIYNLGYNPPPNLVEVLGLLMKARADLKEWNVLDLVYGWDSEPSEKWSPERANELEKSLAHLTSLQSLTCPSIIFFAVRQSYPALQHLDITEGHTNSTLQAGLMAIGACPNLRTIRYEATTFPWIDEATASKEIKPFVLPHLKQLELLNSTHIGYFLQSLDAPALKVLILTHLCISFNALESGFIHLAAHRPPLTKLVFRDFGLSEPGVPLINLLHHLPELVEFEVSEVQNLRKEYFQVLINPTVCPSMKLINVTLSPHDERTVVETWAGDWNVSGSDGIHKIERPESL